MSRVWNGFPLFNTAGGINGYDIDTFFLELNFCINIVDANSWDGLGAQLWSWTANVYILIFRAQKVAKFFLLSSLNMD